MQDVMMAHLTEKGRLSFLPGNYFMIWFTRLSQQIVMLNLGLFFGLKVKPFVILSLKLFIATLIHLNGASLPWPRTLTLEIKMTLFCLIGNQIFVTHVQITHIYLPWDQTSANIDVKTIILLPIIVILSTKKMS